MTSKPHEHISPPLASEELRSAIQGLPETLGALLDNEVVHATYGYGCHLHPELCYIAVRVGTAWLKRFVQDSLEQRIVVPGESDFIFSLRNGEAEVEFCHEGHVHVSGSNEALVQAVLAQLKFTELGRAPSASTNEA